MGIKKYKPSSPGRRWTSGYDFSEITKQTPEKALTIALRKTGGRNMYGRITARARGGGHKRRYRIIDFKRNKYNAEGRVLAVEYDPNRTCRIALIEYADKERRYILCPVGLRVGEIVMSGDNVEIKVGNSMPLANIPPGIPIHNIELTKGRGGIIARAAGNACSIMAKEGKYAHIKMPSGEIRLIAQNCCATIGQVGNVEHDSISLGKAGRSRHLGIRPTSRGVVKNPVDHPMGGGEGKSSGGRHLCNKNGIPAKGFKTRKTKLSDRFIIKKRK